MLRRFEIWLALLFSPCLTSSAQEPFHEWTSDAGTVVKAALVGSETVYVLRKEDGTVIRVPASRLSDKSRTLAEKLLSRQSLEITNSIGMKLKLLPAGEFMMGFPEGEPHTGSDEKPLHLVRLTKPFYLGVTEVTQEQYSQVMGENPSEFKGNPLRPVENVSWADAVEYCRKLSEKEVRTYRLPTEAEWEYACRAGSKTKWSFGDDAATLPEYAWYASNSESTTHPVGQKTPNAWGVYDMHGNVWEWCADWYGDGYYRESPTDDPMGPDSGDSRVLRGGSWHNDFRDAFWCATRGSRPPGFRDRYRGFRVLRTVEP